MLWSLQRISHNSWKQAMFSSFCGWRNKLPQYLTNLSNVLQSMYGKIDTQSSLSLISKSQFCSWSNWVIWLKFTTLKAYYFLMLSSFSIHSISSETGLKSLAATATSSNNSPLVIGPSSCYISNAQYKRHGILWKDKPCSKSFGGTH